MKKLLVHCSYDEDVSYLCRCSGGDECDVDALELYALSGSSRMGSRLGALRGKVPDIKFRGYDLSGYDTVVLACDEWMGGVIPAMGTFIRQNELRGKNVVCIVFGNGAFAKKAADSLKVMVSLSGGTVRNSITVSKKGFKNCEEDLLFYVRHRLAV